MLLLDPSSLQISDLRLQDMSLCLVGSLRCRSFVHISIRIDINGGHKLLHMCQTHVYKHYL